MDYKDTLNLPKTEFPMKADLPKKEIVILDAWKKQDIYKLIRKKSKGRDKYVLHDGPPYANGDIHIGHALNKTLKDIIVKFMTMRGYDSAFIPGWDCHGLPVEHQLFRELKIEKHQIKQVDFRKKAHEYAMRFVNIQREQFKRLGVSGDWDNPYLTLGFQYEEAIVRSFGELVRKEYIYRGLKPVNWCYVCETALAEAEVEYEEQVSDSIYVKFEIFAKGKLEKIAGGKKIYAVVWTTTPWTLIANVAIAVHPEFKYALLEVNNEIWLLQEDLAAGVMAKLNIKNCNKIEVVKGKDLENLSYKDIFQPVRDSNFKFVMAEYVSREEGTGCVHTAPGHGQEDYLTGQKYNLKTVMPVDKEGKFFQDVAMEFKGQHVFQANEGIINKLNNQGNLLAAEKFSHSYPHCWRCKTPIIFRATEQWFMDIDKHNLRKKILEVVDKEIAWIPFSGKGRISTMIQLRPHWCLSRQRYWGVPIPAIRCLKCNREFLELKVIDNLARLVSNEGTDCWFQRDLKDFLPAGFSCPNPDCRGEDFIKGSDILDVWFDSGVSHQAVLKKNNQLDFPCGLYLEGSDQHRGWFQSSLISSMAIDDKPPYRSVLTHGFVVDGEGRKMSKSLGNVISPQDIIKDYGADILRMWVASSDYNEDIRISKEILARLSEAYRKIRNTFRFILSNLYDFDPDENKLGYDKLKKIDKYFLKRLQWYIGTITNAYDSFLFHEAFKAIYDICNIDLSMYYLDMIKGRFYTCARNSDERRAAQTSVYEILDSLVRLIAPILAFTADEIWGNMPKQKKNSSVVSVHLLDFPVVNSVFAQEDLERQGKDTESELKPVITLKPEVDKALEEKRGQGLIGSSFDAKIILLTNDEFRYKYLESLKGSLSEIFKVSQVDIEKKDRLDPALVAEKYPDIGIVIEKAEGEKCVRCWNYSDSIGKNKFHPLLCERCSAAVSL